MILEIFFNQFIEIFMAYLFADLIMGVYHWIKDTYFCPFTPFIGRKLIWGSRLHHIRPRFIIEFTDWQLFYDSAKYTCIWMLPLFYFKCNLFVVALFFVISLNDVIHKYAHMYDHERPRWATFMQNAFIFQSHNEHHTHHISPHEVNYCPITPFLNIILQQFDFWKKLEHIIEKYLHVKARAQIDEFAEDATYPAGIKFIPHTINTM